MTNPHEEVEALVARVQAQILKLEAHGGQQSAADLRALLALSALSKGKEGRDEPIPLTMRDMLNIAGAYDGELKMLGGGTRLIPDDEEITLTMTARVLRDIRTAIQKAYCTSAPQPSLRDVTEAEVYRWAKRWFDAAAELRRAGRLTPYDEGCMFMLNKCAQELTQRAVHHRAAIEALQNSRNDGRKRLEALADAADQEKIQYALVTAYGHGGRIVFINDLRALLSEPQRLAERVGWLPIESAPDTGSFLVWCQERRNIYVVVRNRFLGQPNHPASEFLHFSTGLYGLTEDPTHWQPLPEPPNE
jgi:Protein of unknown function (DUF551)